MADRLEALEARVRTLEERLAKLERRARAAAPEPVIETAREETRAPQSTASEVDIALAGKALIGMGGAYFLRAITENQIVPKAAGIALGLAYAALWIYIAWRSAEKSRRHATVFAMIVSALVAYPLIWEATARFNGFNAITATLAAIVVSVALLWIAFKYGVNAGVWIASFGLIACEAGVALATERVSIPLIGLTLTGAVIWELCRRREWDFAPWPLAFVSGIAGMPLLLLVTQHHGQDSEGLAVFALLLLAVAYLTVTHIHIDIAGVAQSAFVVAIGFGGAIRIAADKPFLEVGVLITIITVGVIAYYRGFAQRGRLAAYYLSFLGIIAVLMATGAVTTPVVAGILWSAFAVITILIAQMVKASELTVHTMLYSLAAAAAGGLLSGSLMTIAGVGAKVPLTYPRMMTATLLITATVLAFLATENESRRHVRISRMVLLSISLLITIAGVALIAVSLTSSDPGVAAAIRSVVIAIAAVALAFASRTRTFADASYLVYPLLGIGAAKFVVDDFLAGRASTLFVTLAVYGFALLVLAKMRGRTTSTTAAA